MSDWEKLKTDMDKLTADLSDIGFVIEWAKLWNPIEDYVDGLVEENKQLRYVLERNYTHPEFDDTGLDGCKYGESIRKEVLDDE